MRPFFLRLLAGDSQQGEGKTGETAGEAGLEAGDSQQEEGKKAKSPCEAFTLSQRAVSCLLAAGSCLLALHSALNRVRKNR